MYLNINIYAIKKFLLLVSNHLFIFVQNILRYVVYTK